MPACVVVAVIRPHPEAIDEVRSVLVDVTAEVHQENGCELYALHEAVGGELVFVEKWSSREAWQAHMDGPLVSAIGDRVSHLLAVEPEIFELASAPAGTATQGTL